MNGWRGRAADMSQTKAQERQNEVRHGDWSLGLFRTGCVGDKTPNRIEEYDRMKLKNTTE